MSAHEHLQGWKEQELGCSVGAAEQGPKTLRFLVQRVGDIHGFWGLDWTRTVLTPWRKGIAQRPELSAYSERMKGHRQYDGRAESSRQHW